MLLKYRQIYKNSKNVGWKDNGTGTLKLFLNAKDVLN